MIIKFKKLINMKSAISLLKLAAFLIALQWLCSCTDEDAIIRQVQQYEDSITLCNRRIAYIDAVSDSIFNAYTKSFPARAYPRTPAGALEAERYSDSEHVAYAAFLAAQSINELRYDSIRDSLLNKKMQYQHIVSSLKEELKK